jgi:adenylate cyclase
MSFTSERSIRNFLPFFRFARNARLEQEERARNNAHLRHALEAEKQRGQRVAVRVRSIALIVIAILLPFMNPHWDVLYYEAIIAIFLFLGWAHLRFAKVGQSRAELALIFLDLVLLTVTLLVPNPFIAEVWPTAAQYRFEGFIYFFLFLAGSTLAYSWRTVLTVGIWGSTIWLAAMVLILVFGTTIPEMTQGIESVFSGRERLIEIFDPNEVNVSARIQEAVVFLIITVILGLKSWRSNEMLMKQSEIAAERANLSRYFPPTLVDELAHHDEPLGKVRSQDVAVLFADIVGFTQYAESHSAEQVIALLRRFHAILEEKIFAHGGTLDKYLGDGVMATFGTPNSKDGDALNALRAAIAMHQAVEEWNCQRATNQEELVHLSVGINYGNVILGDIGTERRLEFAALGDTVNVASRLEQATRAMQCAIIASRTLVERIRLENPGESLLENLEKKSGLAIRGRREKVDTYILYNHQLLALPRGK